jgi:uncharacterized tellurite resistance protein B-like protein
MLNLNRFFAKQEDGAESVPKDETERVQVATCALLLEIAHSDDEFDDAERDTILTIVQKEFDLSKKLAHELIDLSNKERDKSIDLWQFAKAIRERYSDEEKAKVMETVWQVIYADGTLDPHEDYLVHKLSKLLGLSHKQLIDAKLRVTGKKQDGH